MKKSKVIILIGFTLNLLFLLANIWPMKAFLAILNGFSKQEVILSILAPLVQFIITVIALVLWFYFGKKEKENQTVKYANIIGYGLIILAPILFFASYLVSAYLVFNLAATPTSNNQISSTNSINDSGLNGVKTLTADEMQQKTAPQQQVTQNPIPSPTQSQTVASNKFTYQSKPGDKVGGMVLDKISSNDSNQPATTDNVHAEFTGTITVTGTLTAPTGNPADAGMGPQYSLGNITPDSVKLLPYLQSDTRSIWFGVRNPEVMKNFQVTNGDKVKMTINRYYYTFWPADAWNEVDIVSVVKVQ